MTYRNASDRAIASKDWQLETEYLTSHQLTLALAPRPALSEREWQEVWKLARAGDEQGRCGFERCDCCNLKAS